MGIQPRDNGAATSPRHAIIDQYVGLHLAGQLAGLAPVRRSAVEGMNACPKAREAGEVWVTTQREAYKDNLHQGLRSNILRRGKTILPYMDNTCRHGWTSNPAKSVENRSPKFSGQ